MQTQFSTLKILLNILCVSFNFVKSTKIHMEKNNSETCKQKLLANSKDGIFKLPKAVKESSRHEYLNNNSSNNTDYSNSHIDDILDFTLSPISGRKSKLNPIQAGDNISDHLAKLNENSIASIENLIQSIDVPDQSNNTKNHQAINYIGNEKDIKVKKLTDNGVSDSYGINTKKTVHTKISKRISNNSTKTLKDVNNKSGDINSQRNLCSDIMFIDQYIAMINDPHIYSIPPDFFPEERKISKPIFPFFHIESHTVDNSTFYSIKNSNSTSTRVIEAKNTETQDKKIDIPIRSITRDQQSTRVSQKQCDQSDNYSSPDYKFGKNISKKRKLTFSDNLVDISGQVKDKRSRKKRKTKIKINITSTNKVLNKTKNVVDTYDFSEKSSSSAYNTWLPKPKLKKYTTRDKPSVTIETPTSVSNADVSETNINNNSYHTFSLNGQNIQHNFGLPGNSFLVLENINEKLEKTKYKITVNRKYNKLRNVYRMNFYIPITNLNKLEIETSANIQSIIFHIITSEYKIQQYVNITIYSLRNNDDTPHKVFVKNFSMESLPILITKLLDVCFPVYTFSNVGSNNIIKLEYHKPEKDMSLMSVRQYINYFQETKHLLRTESPLEFECFSGIFNALRYANPSDSRRICTWFYTLSIIKEDCLAFIESIEDIIKVLNNISTQDDAFKIHIIKKILLRMISRVNQKLYCSKTTDIFNKAYLHETLAMSFQMFLKSEIIGVLKYWMQHIAATDEMMEIFPYYIQ